MKLFYAESYQKLKTFHSNSFTICFKPKTNYVCTFLLAWVWISASFCKMKLLEKCHWRCSVIFIVSPVFNAALDVPGIGEMIFQWVLYFCQNNEKYIFSSQSTYRQMQFDGCICENIKILLCQVNFTKYDYDKCQRKNRSGSFPWRVVARQRYPKKEFLQMFWVFTGKRLWKFDFSKKLQLSKLCP